MLRRSMFIAALQLFNICIDQCGMFWRYSAAQNSKLTRSMLTSPQCNRAFVGILLLFSPRSLCSLPNLFLALYNLLPLSIIPSMDLLLGLPVCGCFLSINSSFQVCLQERTFMKYVMTVCDHSGSFGSFVSWQLLSAL